MHAYGHSRRDKLECKHGCCTGKSGKDRSCRKEVDRAKRKTARRDSQQVALNELKGADDASDS